MATRLGSESPHTGGKRRSWRSCSSNIVAKFTGSRITGRGFGRGTQVRGRSRGAEVWASERWSTQTGDLRWEPCPKTKTLCGGVGWGCCRPGQPRVSLLTVTLRGNITHGNDLAVKPRIMAREGE